MSEPMTNVQIEDVLSSIRKLVSDGDKSRSREEPIDMQTVDPVAEALADVVSEAPTPLAPATPVAAPAAVQDIEQAAVFKSSAPERFVLTPAFLVSDMDDAGQGTDASDLSHPDQDTAKLDRLNLTEMDRAYPLNDAPVHADPIDDAAIEGDPVDEDLNDENLNDAELFDDSADAVAPDLDTNDVDNDDSASVAPLALTDVIPLSTPQPVSDVAAEFDADVAADDIVEFDEEPMPQASTDIDAHPAVDAAPAEPTQRSDLIATIAELEAAVSVDANDFEPDGSEVARETMAWPESEMQELDALEVMETHADEPFGGFDELEETLPTDQASGAPDSNVTAFQLHTPEVAEIEAVVDDTPDHVAPVLDDQTEPAAAQDFVEPAVAPAEDEADADFEFASVNHAPEVESVDQDLTQDDEFADDDLDGLLDAGTVNLDDAAVRALVSDVVREELAGPLGEKITRNVRKLVRREIYRILSSKEFD